MTTRRHVHFNSKAKSWTSPEPASAEAIDRFHQSLPNYEPTPLVSLDSLAKEIGVGAVHVKDETNRFGLPAFKILGASWGAFRSITEKFGLPLDSDIDTAREAAKSHQLTLYAATEGNHGRAVARMGAIFDISAEIHVPASMHPSTVKLIESEGAKVVISKGRYEDAMLEAESASKHEKGIMVQDHAFGDYQTVPQASDWIVDGYGTMMREVDKQLGSTKADLVIAPVGVGSFAQAVVSHFKRQGTSTSTLTVEPDTAACLWKSLEKGEFTEIPTTGTIMAGLNCGAPSTIAWDLLKNGVDASLTVSDYEAHQSVLYLQSQGINAGPCGASTLAALRRLTPDDKKALGLNEKSTVVIFCTERNRDYDVPHGVSGTDPVALTQTLVQINSASPDLGSVPGPGETTIARYVAAWLEHRDLETHWVEYTKGRPSVVGVVRGSGGGKSVMFNGHLDTVTIMGYDDDPLSGKIVDGRLYGRGSADMKGGVAAGMIALANTKKLGLRGDVIFTGVADEESLSKGTEDILRAGWRADAAVVSESTNLEINHAHKGYCHVEIKVYGLAAHGSRADLGIDAIVNAGHFLVEFGKYVQKLQEGPGDETLGTGTAHASVISGGEEASSYPAQCTIIAERRTIPGETNEVVQKEFDDMIASVAKEVTDFKAEAKIFFSRPPQFTAEDHPFTKLVSGVVGTVTGKDAVIAGAPFWTDCALLAEKGIVPLLWGPKGEGFHGKEEFVHINSIEQVAEGLANIAAEFCKLVGALQRYKEDTNSVAAWLASTAKHYGYKSQAAGPNDKDAQQEASGRLKGKALKEAKSQPTGTKNGTGQKYIVALNDYVPMAEDIARHRKPTILAFVVSLSRPGSPPGPSNVDESVGPLIQHFNTILGYCEPQKKHAKRGKGTRLQSEATFEIFKILPAFSGLYLCHARVDAADIALKLIKDAGVMTVMTHLHNAMQQLQRLKTPWVDMETFEKCFEARDLFFATKPLGFPPSALKNHKGFKRRESRELFKSFIPEIQGVAPVSMIFAGIVHQRLIPDLSWDELAYVLSVSLYKEVTDDDGTHGLVSLDSEERKQVKNRFTKPKSKDRQQSAPHSPDQLLRQFALALAGESRELAFPYMEMHNLYLLLFSNISDRRASTLDALDLRIDPLGQTLSVMLRIISLASTKHEVVILREAAGVIAEHINANPAIVTEKIANVGAFGSIPIPSFELYKIPRTMFVKVSADTRPVDEVIVIPFQGSDSSLGEMEEINKVPQGHSHVDPPGTPHQKVGEDSQSSVIHNLLKDSE
ncbi:diaminopropionate ammonia-lyase [Fusarium oxysporum f. sp. phaseoli]